MLTLQLQEAHQLEKEDRDKRQKLATQETMQPRLYRDTTASLTARWRSQATAAAMVMLVNKGSVGCNYRPAICGAFNELNPVMQYPISDGFKIVYINSAPTLADESGAFERVEQQLM